MGRPISETVTLVAAVANGYATTQALGAAGPLALNGSLVTGGVGVPDAPRRVIITSAGNDSGITWTITGTQRSQQNSSPLVEVIKGANIGVAASTQDFATVTSIVGSGATAGNVTAGTNGTGSGPWVPWSDYAVDFQVSCAGNVLSGAPTWQVDYTYDDVFDPAVLASGPVVFVHASLQGQVGSADGVLPNAVRASRLTLTAVGSVRLTQLQQGV
jgi:hypothetical protein